MALLAAAGKTRIKVISDSGALVLLESGRALNIAVPRPPLVTLLLLASGPARERQHLSRASGGRDAIFQRYCAGTSP